MSIVFGMQFIRDIHSQRLAEGKPVISFEFFPPKTDDGDRALIEKTLPALLQLKPDYCSVTYGAGGGTREKTLAIVNRIQREHGLTAMAHLTCVNATRQQIEGVLAEAKELGIKNILALRGDPPNGEAVFTPLEGGFEYSSQLVRFIRETGGFCIGVAGFPEGHIAARDGKQADWDRLKAKIDEGADFVLTQLFFDNSNFLEFRDYLVRQLGVAVPICPGILPILNVNQIKRFTNMCGARIPAPMLARLDELGDDSGAVTEFGIEYASRQCEELLREGVPGIHFYTLNKVHSTAQILRNLCLTSA
jgi:methylenetetrahydrofolate reductase (NADPH)